MVLDKLENSKRYTYLGERITKAFKYLEETDLAQTPSGKYEIDKEDIFAIVQEYDTKETKDAKLEGHYKYIDIQYLISGSEQMGVKPLTIQEPVTINRENDCAFYDDDYSLIKVEAGMFAIFYPDDLHMPGIKMNQISKVKKVVVKVKV